MKPEARKTGQQAMRKIATRPKSLKETPFHYCAGCGHSIIHRLIAEVMDEMDIADRTIGIPPAGCAVVAYNYFDVDMLESPHGRGCAVATGMKRILPDRVIFTYQGDGDLAAIGTAETFHAANRGENITVIFINNAVYGMTGGQMAPTTLLGQTSTTTPPGRSAHLDGYPVHLSEILAHLPGTAYIERCAVNSAANIIRARRAIRKAFTYQMQNYGFSLVEILSQCPTNWKMTPVEACRWIDAEMVREYPLGVIKDTKAKG